MSKRQDYVVIAPYVTLKTATPDGIRLMGFYKDAPVPDDVDQGVIDRHVEAGMIAPAGKEPDPEPTPADRADQSAEDNAAKVQRAQARPSKA